MDAILYFATTLIACLSVQFAPCVAEVDLLEMNFIGEAKRSQIIAWNYHVAYGWVPVDYQMPADAAWTGTYLHNTPDCQQFLVCPREVIVTHTDYDPEYRERLRITDWCGKHEPRGIWHGRFRPRQIGSDP